MGSKGLVALLAIAAVALSVAAQPPQQQKLMPLTKRIPTADPTKYPGRADWQSPTLTMEQGGMITVRIGAVWSPITIPSATSVQAKDVVAFLNTLPDQAWPYGLVVKIQPPGVVADDHTSEEHKQLQRMDSELRSRLRKGRIAVYRGAVTTG